MRFTEGYLVKCIVCDFPLLTMPRYTVEEDEWFEENRIEYPPYQHRHPCCGTVATWLFNIPARSQVLL